MRQAVRSSNNTAISLEDTLARAWQYPQQRQDDSFVSHEAINARLERSLQRFDRSQRQSMALSQDFYESIKTFETRRSVGRERENPEDNNS